MSSTSATIALQIRPSAMQDFPAWKPLWDGYNAFYGRVGPTALPDAVTHATWQRFHNPLVPMFALLAERDGAVLGLVHYLFHASTSRLQPVCYLQDLFTVPESRGQGVGRALIEAVYQQARLAGASRVYWQTQTTNSVGRALYDQVAEHKGFIVYGREIEAAVL
ncbi:GNAT family N-acetyltransferase [Comamonas sp. J-3]|uniref:GNAT family N-acetyltransferase n=1 Tax=Comamonas trifloxystrobinivorans TaxID=3350256 RepID=UPI00372739BD